LGRDIDELPEPDALATAGKRSVAARARTEPVARVFFISGLLASAYQNRTEEMSAVC
jgi:hypothetical protein